MGYPHGDIQWAVRYNGLKLKREVWAEDKYWKSLSCIVTNAIGMGEPKKEFWGITKIYHLEDREEYPQKPERKGPKW